MQAQGAAPQPEDLLAHAGWIRNLALRLAHDESSADDLVQETWITALTRPRQRSGPLRPWLGRVLTNVARQRARGDGRRRRREAAVAAERTVMPSTAELAQRLDLQQKLVEHVQALKEPYRRAIVLRYFEGLSAAEIARRSNVPDGTVRSHLSRALDELRGRLDEDHGGQRAAWAGTVLGWVTPALPGGSTPLGTGGASGVLGPTTSLLKGLWLVKKLIAVAAFAVLAIWTVSKLRDDAPALAPDAAVRPGAVVAALDSVAELADPKTATPDSTAPRPDTPGARSDALSAQDFSGDAGSVASAPFALRLVVVDSRGAAIQGASLRLEDGAIDVSDSDENGNLSATLESDDDVVRHRAEVWKDGYASTYVSLRIERGVVADLGRIELGAAGAVSGRVLDERGHPIEGARVLAVSTSDYDEAREIDRLRAADSWPERPAATTDSSGAYFLPSVPTGFRRIRAEARDRLYAYSEPLEVHVGVVTENVELRLAALPADVRVEGVVQSPDGTPLPDVWVRWWRVSAYGRGSSAVRTDEEGRFRVLTVAAPLDLLALDPEKRWSGGFHAQAEPGTLDLVLQFEEPRSIQLTVQDRGGHPLEHYGLLVVDAQRERPLTTLRRADRAGGRTTIHEPSVPYRLTVDPEGAEIVEVGPLEPGEAPSSMTVTAALLPGIEGRVVHGGAPVANAEIGLYRRLRDDESIERNGYLTKHDPDGVEWIHTDAEGEFRLTTRTAGDLTLRIEPPSSSGGRVTTEFPLDGFEPRDGRRVGDIVLDSGGSIEGRVTTTSGSAAGAIVAVSRYDLFPRTQRVGTDGAFRFSGLMPGPWLVELVDEPFDTTGGTTTSWSSGLEEPPTYATNCVVHPGATTPFDLNLEELEPCRLRGSFWIDAEDVTAWTVTLRRKNGGQRASARDTATLDERGHFALEIPATTTAATEVDLELATTDETRQIRVSVTLELFPGDNEWQRELTTGTLDLTPRPGAERATFLNVTDEFDYVLRVELEDERPVMLAGLPVGAGRCTQERLEDGTRWVELGANDVEIEAGRTTRVGGP